MALSPPTVRPYIPTKKRHAGVGEKTLFSIARVPGSFRTAPTALPLALTQFAALGSPGPVFIIGGFTQHHRINPIYYTLTTAGAVADGRMTYPHADGAALVLPGKVEYVGGLDHAGKATPRIQPISFAGTATSASDHWLKTSISAMATASDGSGAYLIGGTRPSGASNLIYRFRPGLAPQVWSRLPEALSHPMAAIYRKSLWVIGGYSPTQGYSRSVYTINLSSGQVTNVAQLPIGLADGAVVPYQGSLWILGGVGARGESRSTFVIEPSGSIVHPGPKLPEAVRGNAAFVLSGRLWVGGGTMADGKVTRQLWWYQPPKALLRHDKTKPRAKGGHLS